MSHPPVIIQPMTKLREIARITRTVTEDSASTSVRRGNPNNPAFMKVQMLRHDAAMTLRDLTLAAVAEHGQPMTVPEITAFLNQVLGTDYNEPRVRYGLDALVADKKLFTRKETAEERTLRGNGAKVTLNKPAVLYSTYSVVPPRTEVEVVPGIILKGVDSPRKPKEASIKKKYNPRATTKEAVGVDRSMTETNAALDFLIEKLVAERTADIQNQLNEANAKLEQFKKLLA
jgi:hypothetical protein